MNDIFIAVLRSLKFETYLLGERNLEYLNLISASINICHINNSMDVKYANAHGKKKREREREREIITSRCRF